MEGERVRVCAGVWVDRWGSGSGCVSRHQLMCRCAASLLPNLVGAVGSERSGTAPAGASGRPIFSLSEEKEAAAAATPAAMPNRPLAEVEAPPPLALPRRLPAAGCAAAVVLLRRRSSSEDSCRSAPCSVCGVCAQWCRRQGMLGAHRVVHRCRSRLRSFCIGARIGARQFPWHLLRQAPPPF